jgi:hypothetical protein
MTERAAQNSEKSEINMIPESCTHDDSVESPPIKPAFNHELSAENIKKWNEEASRLKDRINKDLDIIHNRESAIQRNIT